MNWLTYVVLPGSIFGVGMPPGELVSCDLLALPAGVRKSAFLFTVLPFTPAKALGRGVLGTNPSSLDSISAIHGSCQLSQPTCRTYPLPSLLVWVVTA
jgi:hypothetical protein